MDTEQNNEREQDGEQAVAEEAPAVQGPVARNRSTFWIAGGVLAVGAIIALFVGGIIPLPSISSSGSVAAVVNGEKITRAYVDERLEQARPQLEAQGFDWSNEEMLAQLKQQAVQDLVNETLLLQKAKELGVAVDDEDVEAEFSGIVDSLGGQEAFEQALAGVNLTEARLRTDLRRQLYIERYIEQFAASQGIAVSDVEINELYDGLAEQNDELPPLEEVRESLRNELRQQKIASALVPHIDELRAAAEIEIL